MTRVFLNRIATAVPPHDIHQAFVDYAPTRLLFDKERSVFKRLVQRAQIDHRYSFIRPGADASRLDSDEFYVPGDFPETDKRMAFYEANAFTLAKDALDRLDINAIKDKVTHIIVTTCTGFYAPGIDLQIMAHYGLKSTIERTIIGFMGCQAALNALKMARHVVRSQPDACVVILNLELCTIHLQDTDDLEQMMSYLIFADGCAASVVSSQESGAEIQNFHSTVVSDTKEQITWHIKSQGFDMNLSRQVPATIAAGLPANKDAILDGTAQDEIKYWAVHPGGSGVLDAVESGMALPTDALSYSRRILRDYGNMSSATVMFVLQDILAADTGAGTGCAMSFGPGLSVESMMFKLI